MPYATADELKALLQPDGATFERDDALYEALVEEASEAIDNYCGRTFLVPTIATMRIYRPSRDGTYVFGLRDIATTDGLIVTVNGTPTTDYYVEIDDRTGMVTGLFSVNGFPLSERQIISVTAKYGWPAVPGPVHRACLIWATRLYTRKDSPAGVLGFGDMGGVTLRALDPDVQSLLNPYVDFGRMLG